MEKIDMHFIFINNSPYKSKLIESTYIKRGNKKKW